MSELNDRQREAVCYLDGPQLVIAGAGSGKTRVLTYKIAYLLNNGYKSYNILALTFTNKAAREMKERIRTLVGEDVASELWMGTFHSMFLRILRINSDRIGFKHDFTIYDTTDSKSLIKTIIRDMQLDEKLYTPAEVHSRISAMKNSLISPADYEADNDMRAADSRARRPMMYALYKAYWNRCRIAGAMDFDDLLFYTNILFRDNPDLLEKYRERFKYILVDEYQDTNFAQHLIVSQLGKQHGHICVVGDDAQSIYSFRGANVANILNLNKYYDNLRIFKLEQNYRSTQTIIDAANSLIEKNTQQIKKHIFSENSRGNKISVLQAYSDFEEGYLVANQIINLRARRGDGFDEFAILYRTNAQSRILEEALRKRNIPYRIYGGQSFYQRKEIKDAISYFRLVINPDDDEALRRIINYPARGIGESTMAKLTLSSIKNNVSLWNVINALDKYDTGVNAGTRKKLEAFASFMAPFIKDNADGMTADKLGQEIMNGTKLISMLESEKTPENISRKENLLELLNSLDEYVRTKIEEGADNVTMANFLGEIALQTDQDTNTDDSGSAVTLMTVHAAKGLEFNNVIIVGVEEDLFPSSMSRDSIAEIEEERRLLYVAITRAKSTCTITYARSRYKNGQTKTCTMSRFIKDIDPQFLSMTQSSGMSSGSYDFNKSRDEWNTRYIRTDNNRSSLAASTQQSKPSVSIFPSTTLRPVANQASTSTNPADFCLHTADELRPGMKIEHSRFGFGTINNIEASGADTKITVDFGNVGTKSLILKFARFKILKTE